MKRRDLRQMGGTHWRVPGIKPGTQVYGGLETQMRVRAQAGKQREDLDGNTRHLPKEVREGGCLAK